MPLALFVDLLLGLLGVYRSARGDATDELTSGNSSGFHWYGATPVFVSRLAARRHFTLPDVDQRKRVLELLALPHR